tara:strand:+ start:610 stop:858 length:249 start_codon:yes stop_codon:yes gene_type:complete
MSIAFKNWVMDEQEKEEEKMIEEIKNKEYLQDLKMILRKVLNTESMTIDARSQISLVIKKLNREIIRIEKLLEKHEEQEAPC